MYGDFSKIIKEFKELIGDIDDFDKTNLESADVEYYSNVKTRANLSINIVEITIEYLENKKAEKAEIDNLYNEVKELIDIDSDTDFKNKADVFLKKIE